MIDDLLVDLFLRVLVGGVMASVLFAFFPEVEE